jgi:hypothetical protein
VTEVARITKHVVVRPGVARLFFDSGEVREIVWKQYAKAGTIFEPLADAEYAAKARRVHGGHALAWPGGLDWSAGGLLSIGTALADPREKLAADKTSKVVHSKAKTPTSH